MTKKRVCFYKSPEAGKTSLQVIKTEGFDGITRNYTYDNMGNITQVSSQDSTNTYEYDSLSRLIKEYNSSLNQTITYSYCLNNNISKVRYYSGDGTTSLLKEEIYNYDSSYKDKLLSVTTLENGINKTEYISYGEAHTPINFYGKSLIWQGRRLVKVGNNITYKYNESGLRTSKTVNGITTDYHLIGNKVSSLTKGNNKLYFHYNERDLLVGFEYNKQQYFYSRDLTGVITSIVDINGNILVKYNYDAWGKPLSKINVSQTSIGQVLIDINPFIYKGYIYDDERILLFKSRYYSPVIRRFINVDVLFGTLEI